MPEFRCAGGQERKLRETGHCPSSGSALAKPSVDHIPLGGFVLVMEGLILTTPNSTLKPRYPLGRRTKGRTTINHGTGSIL
jgi:hypothetical protein